MRPHIAKDETGNEIATVHEASQADVDFVLSQPIDPDGRSEPVWVRLANGDLILGVFPQGGTYEQVSGYGAQFPGVMKNYVVSVTLYPSATDEGHAIEQAINHIESQFGSGIDFSPLLPYLKVEER